VCVCVCVCVAWEVWRISTVSVQAFMYPNLAETKHAFLRCRITECRFVVAFIHPYLAETKHSFFRDLITDCRFVLGARLGASFDSRSVEERAHAPVLDALLLSVVLV